MDRQKPTLVIMAAGMGSRFGGLKHIFFSLGINGWDMSNYQA